MSSLPPPECTSDALQRLAGYLNFSSGASDPATLQAWNLVYDEATRGDPMTGPPAWLIVKDWFSETLESLSRQQEAFRDCRQGGTVDQHLVERAASGVSGFSS